MIMMFFKKACLCLWILLNADIHAVEFERKVASRLASSCMMKFLRQNKDIPVVGNYSGSFSEQELQGTPHNYCAMAVVDCTTEKANYFLYDYVPAAIKRLPSACVEEDECAVFVSNFENKSLKDNIKRLYKQYFQSLAGTAVLESIPDVMSNVRRSDSEQAMLLALETVEVRDELFAGMDINKDIRLVVYSLRNSCQHCHFMLGGFLKEMLEAQKLRAIDFFFSFSLSASCRIVPDDMRKRTSVCLIPPLFRNIPFLNEESIKSLVLADCKLYTTPDSSILFPGRVKDEVVANLLFEQAGAVFQENISKPAFVKVLNDLIPGMDLNVFRRIAQSTLVSLWDSVAHNSEVLNGNTESMLLSLLSRVDELRGEAVLSSLEKITPIAKHQQFNDLCKKLGLLK